MSTYLDLYNPRRPPSLNGNLLPVIGPRRGLEPDPQIQQLLRPYLDKPVNVATDQVANRVFPPLDGQFVRNPIVTNPETVAEAVKEIAEPIISQTSQTVVSEPTAAAFPTTVKTITDSNILLAGLPVVFWLLYNSKATHLRNIVVHIKATKSPKNYCITLGKGTNEQKISFNVKTGSPVRFLNENREGNCVSSRELPPVLFKDMQFNETFLGPLRELVWRRQEFYTDCNIFIDDPQNPQLQNGPAFATISASSNETIRVIQRDPQVMSAPFNQQDQVSAEEAAAFASMQVNTIDLTKKANCDVRLPIVDANGEKLPDEYIHIVQKDAERSDFRAVGSFESSPGF